MRRWERRDGTHRGRGVGWQRREGNKLTLGGKHAKSCNLTIRTFLPHTSRSLAHSPFIHTACVSSHGECTSSARHARSCGSLPRSSDVNHRRRHIQAPPCSLQARPSSPPIDPHCSAHATGSLQGACNALTSVEALYWTPPPTSCEPRSREHAPPLKQRP